MEASDSEHFESADEDFEIDGETVKKTVKNIHENVEYKNVQKTQDVDRNKNTKTCNMLHKIEETDCNCEPVKHSKKTGRKLGQKLTFSETVDHNFFSKNEIIDEISTSGSKESADVETNLSNSDKVDEEGENLWQDSEMNWDIENDSHKSEQSDYDWENNFQRKCTVQENESAHEARSGWTDWGKWNVSSILSTASEGVSNITNHVSYGLNSVLESSMGVLSPEEMARLSILEQKEIKNQNCINTEVSEMKNEDCSKNAEESNQNDNSPLGFGLGNFVLGVTHLTKLVETTSTKVITGGLETLETIGKKTMEVLQEGDPGLKKKRAFLQISHNKPNLSQILREAKEKAETENKIFEEQHICTNIKNYEAFFDDHQGLVHLEALELLSKQCNIHLQTILDSNSGDALIELQETMEQVKELCELPDEDEDEQLTLSDIIEKLNVAITEINVPISYDKLLSTWEEINNWLNSLKLHVCGEKELHQQAIETLAHLTAQAVEQFHKAGELLLTKEHRSTADEADSLVQLTTTLTSFIGIVAAKFSEKLNSKAAASTCSEEAVNSLITNVFFEAGNSSTYIQDAFQLLIPVLQVGAL